MVGLKREEVLSLVSLVCTCAQKFPRILGLSDTLCLCPRNVTLQHTPQMKKPAWQTILCHDNVYRGCASEISSVVSVDLTEATAYYSGTNREVTFSKMLLLCDFLFLGGTSKNDICMKAIS